MGKRDKDILNSKLEKKQKRDKSAIQTLFRTVSKNNYTLIETIDRKASIVLTINSILISLVLGSIYLIPETDRSEIELIANITIYSSVLSMVLALGSIIPHKYRHKKSLLYPGSFPSMERREFQSKFNKLIEEGQSIYDAMINEIYDMSLAIKRRQLLIKSAVVVVIIGIVVNLSISFLNNY